MRVTEERVQRLARLGLTESQARGYLALLDLGAATVGEASRAASVPRTRLYPVLHELHTLGLADILEGEPLRYAPRSLERFVGQRVEAMREEVDRLSAELPALLNEFRLPGAPTGVEGSTRVFRGRRQATRHLHEAIESAEREIVLACTRHTLDRLSSAGIDALLAFRAASGIRVQIVVPEGVGLPPQLEAAVAALDILRVPASFPLEVLLIDGQRSVTTTLRPDDRSCTRGDDEGLVSASPAIFALFSGALGAFASGASGPEFPGAFHALAVTGGLTTQD